MNTNPLPTEPRQDPDSSALHRNPGELSRRRFLKTSAVVSGAFSFVPVAVLGLNGAPSANSKLNLAGIGVGGQGASDLRELESENIVALCDVDHAYARRVFQKYPKAKVFKDYRKMLEELKEIDGVVVATPDHHHAFASMEAIRRGKHVYCEKPLTHSVWEARQLAKAAREAKVATQMGNQGQASRRNATSLRVGVARRDRPGARSPCLDRPAIAWSV